MKIALQIIFTLIAIGAGIACCVYGAVDMRVGNDGGAVGLGIICAAALVMVGQLEISKKK